MDATRNAMLVTSDARAYGIVSGMRRGFNGKQPRTSAPEITSDCIVYRPNGDTFILKTTRNRNHKRAVVRTAKTNHAANYARLLELGAIGNQD